MNRDFTGLGAEHITLNANEITYVEQFLEHHVIEVFVLTRAKLVAIDIDLYAATRILKLHKRGFPPLCGDP